MARTAARCSSIISRSSLAAPLLKGGNLNSATSVFPLLNRYSWTLATPMRSHDNLSKAPTHFHATPSAAIFSTGYSSNQNQSLFRDPLVNKIESAKCTDELFCLIGRNKAKLTENHLAQAFFVLASLRQATEEQNEFSNQIKLRQEFISLCDLAENRASDFDDSVLINVLYFSLKLLRTSDHSLIRELRNESLKRINRLKPPQLSKMAVCLADLGEKKGKYMGEVVEALSHVLDETKHIRELSAFMKECNLLMSGKLKSRVLRKLKEFVDPKHPGVLEATSSDFRKVFMSVDKFTDVYQDILHKCTSLMWNGLENITTRELCVLMSCIINLGYRNDYLSNHLNNMLQGRLLIIDDPVNMALSTECLGYNAPAHIKFQLEANALRLIEELPIWAVGNLCSGLRRMGYFSKTSLHDKIRNLLFVHCTELTLDMLVGVVEYFRNLVWMDKDSWQIIKSKIFELTMAQISPSQFLRGFYLLSLIPTFEPNDRLFNRALIMLPQLHTPGTNSLFRAMKRMVERSGKEHLSNISLDIMHAVQDQATRSLHKNTSANYLTSLLDSVLTEGGDLELVDALFKQLEQIVHKIGPHNAVECARSLYKTRYFSIPLMDQIINVSTPNIHKVTPMQVLYLLGPFCSLNYQPKSAEQFFWACTERVIPFLENLPCGFLVDMAHLMSYNQHFPNEVLRHIFSLEFLTKLDEELEELPDRCEMYRRKLMYLNRTVALECPELQVPWFHEEYCQEMLKNRHMFYHPDVQEVQKNLVEVLGGAQFLRSFVTTPYYYDITFECVLDTNGDPLSCVNYGSVLNKGSGLSGTVLSDLMQWDTQSKQLPDGAQRVAIDYMFSSAYCVNSGHMLGMSTMKKRHLELLGYQYIQIPFFEWKSLVLMERIEKEEYLRMKLFSAPADQQLLDVATAPPSIQALGSGEGSIFAPFFHRKRKIAGDSLTAKILQTFDRLA